MSPQRVSNYFDELTSRCRSLEDTTHKDTGLCQKCLAVSLGFRSNDQLIIYQVSSTFPKSRATTLSLSLSRHWERARFQDNPSCITLMSSGLHLPSPDQDSPILSAVGHCHGFSKHVFTRARRNALFTSHASHRRAIQDTNFFFFFFSIL